MTIAFTLNGEDLVYDGDPGRSLLSYLRDDRDLTAAKDGCSGEGTCRACTVEIDGRAKLACLTQMSTLTGRTVTTVEGLPEPVRAVIGEAFVKHGAVQCGFCTPGYLAHTRVLLAGVPAPSRAEVVAALRHHVCRCTGYHAIVEAVLEAAAVLQGHAATPAIDTPKQGALDRALGRGPFVDDLRLPGLLHGALCFAHHPRARLIAVDAARAARMPGVIRILAADDVPGERHTGLIHRDWPLLVAPGEITRYVGDVVAIAVADTEEHARAAAGAVVLGWEILPALTDPEAALASDILVHPAGNLVQESRLQRGGDVAAALAGSAHVATGTFTTQRIEHAFLEPEAAVARITDDDALEVFSPGQGVYIDRQQIASLLALPLASVVVHQVAAGGAFGGKEDLSVQGHAALAAWILRRPVKVKLSRAESIRLHPKRHPLRMTYSVGCDHAGRLTALRADILGDTGAYASVGGKVLERAAGHATGAYHVPCIDIVARSVHTNNLPCGAMRGFGVPQVTFAMESCLDDICAQGGFDRWQIRWDNALTGGRQTATGQVLGEGVGLRETLLAVKDDYLRAKHCGLACGIKNCGIGNGLADWCEVQIEVTAVDRLTVRHGWSEMGQGVHTVAQQVVARETGVAPAQVDVVVCTADGAEAGMTTSSRGTSLVGNALIEAAGPLRADLATHPLADLLGRRYRGRWSFDRSTAPGAPGEAITHYSYSYATQLVELDDTGAIARVVAAHDVGHAINPTLLRGQIQGSVHMGLGYALSEHLPIDATGAPTPCLRDLGLLPMDRMPPVEVRVVEVPDPLGPYGAKGVGEVGLVPTAAAVAAAFRAYDGMRRTSLPLAPVEKHP